MVVMTSEVTLAFEWLFLPLHWNVFGFSLLVNFLSVRFTEKTSGGIDKCQNSYRNFSILEILLSHRKLVFLTRWGMAKTTQSSVCDL